MVMFYTESMKLREKLDVKSADLHRTVGGSRMDR